MTSLTGPVLAEYQDLFSSTTTQGGPGGGLNLGAKASTGDGREYRFALAGATAIVPGKVQQSSVENTGWENLAIASAAIGATSITTTSTVTVTANAWAGGYVMVTVTTGQGYIYKIKSNPAVTSAVVTITLEDPIIIALTAATTKIDVIANPYSGIIVNPATASGQAVGVGIFAIAAAQYGWVQTGGATNVLADGTVVVGEEVGSSASVAGAVKATAGVVSDLGIAITGIADTEYGAVFLTIG